jgi:hypothetical protein
MQRFWKWLFTLVVARIRWNHISVCSGRCTRIHQSERWDVLVQIKDKSQPDWYSREELVGMLDAVRREEKRTGWKVPELIKI